MTIDDAWDLYFIQKKMNRLKCALTLLNDEIKLTREVKIQLIKVFLKEQNMRIKYLDRMRVIQLDEIIDEFNLDALGVERQYLDKVLAMKVQKRKEKVLTK